MCCLCVGQQLSEAHEHFLGDLARRQQSVAAVTRVAEELLAGSPTDADRLRVRAQLDQLQAAWARVNQLAQLRAQRLTEARQRAVQFQEQCRSLMDYFAGAEHLVRSLASLATAEDEPEAEGEPAKPDDAPRSLSEAVAAHTRAHLSLLGQAERVQGVMKLGHELLPLAHPDAVPRLRQWLNAVQTRWDSLCAWSEQRGERLRGALEEQRQRRLQRDQLLDWLADLRTELSTAPADEDLERTEAALARLAQLEQAWAERQPLYDAVVGHARRAEQPYRGRRRPAKEPGFVEPRVQRLHAEWAAAREMLRQRRVSLGERVGYLHELERMKQFDFEAWRARYVAWLNANKARVIDLFHRKDLDRDGRLSHREFVDGILEMKFPTSRLELEVVADIMDTNQDGFIDYRECFQALRAGFVPSGASSTWSSQGLRGSSLSLNRYADEEAISDEMRRQIGLCTCHNTYQICKIANNKYRFGDSQKLCLVRVLRSAVMVRVGGGWVNLDQFLMKNDPCRALLWKPTAGDNASQHSAPVLRRKSTASLPDAAASHSSLGQPPPSEP